MESSRLGIESKPKLVPKLRLDKETFAFVKDLKVGDKGSMSFSGLVKAHQGKETDDDEETKRIKFTNLEVGNVRKARIV